MLGRMMRRKRILLAAAPLLACALLFGARAAGVKAVGAQTPEEGFKPTTVILIRHAEKGTDPPADPPLSEAGRARAKELARVLAGVGVKGIYTSQFLRATQTAEPLAAQLGLKATPLNVSVKPSSPTEVTEQSVQDIVKRVEQHAGEAVLVIGHSNSVPDVIRALGGDSVPTIDEKKFDDMFVVTVYARGRARVVHLKYGSPN